MTEQEYLNGQLPSNETNKAFYPMWLKAKERNQALLKEIAECKRQLKEVEDQLQIATSIISAERRRHAKAMRNKKVELRKPVNKVRPAEQLPAWML